ncbi:MAG: hypothetical protein AMJ42_01570 [Deltaproteobacteria bacterium DG_8]|nr:MAG: hypothetical protein AMJ42_01570 [Deltaproteobacteria bacterium DG_8]
MVNRFITIITTGIFFFFSTYPVQGQNRSTGTLFSHNQKIKEEVDRATLFMEANKYYKEEKYKEAALLYERLIQSGVSNGQIYYNLGNSYFKMGLLGKAILSYRLAELYLPRDEDLKANLRYARQLTKDKVESKQFIPFLKGFFFWHSKFNLKELMIVFLIVHSIFWTLAIIRIFWRKEYHNLIFLINLALVVVLGFSLAIKLYNYIYNIDGVVLAKEITVRSGNGFNNTALFQLHDGAEFTIIEQGKDWIKIELSDGKRGWVEGRWVGKCQLHSWPPPANE